MAKLKVIYTGGTIGMRAGENGLAPAGGFDVRMQAQFANTDLLDDWSYTALEPPIDSANVTPALWQRICAAIVSAVEHEGCGSVLVLHGTDTLAFSAAALSFQLLGLPAPVLLTGSMLPAGVAGSDADDNLHGALRALRSDAVSGVQIYFHGALLHGARTRKVRSEGMHPFIDTPASPPQISSPPAALSYRTSRQAVPVAVLTLIPGLQANQLDALVAAGVRGVVMQCYGSGTGPTNDAAFIAALRRADAAGVILLAISQCQYGEVALARYEAGALLQQAGVLSGGAMSLEAASSKLQAVLGAGLTGAEARHWLQENLCGEM